ncbi:MAG: sugar transferase [Salinibacter sp.]|uniref:sugar transferase n=1 Tax=Salinibacter sp. TaxID=2065818 RepID=UPI0035D4A73F
MEIISSPTAWKKTSEVPEFEEPPAEASSPSDPICLSAALPPGKIIRTRKIWSKLLHAAALPVIVGAIVFWLEGEFSAGLFQQAWPVMALLAAAYVGAWVLSSKFERYPFLNQFEAALVSVSVTLVPAGGLFAAMPGSPINTLALFATVGSVGWYLADKFLHRYRKSRLLVLPGGVTDRLLAIPGVSAEKETGWSRGALDGIVADLHESLSDYEAFWADHSMKGVPTYHAGYIYELLTARVLLGASCKESVDVRKRRYYPYVRRAMDLLLIGLSLPITLPIVGLTACAIRLESKGPVLFWQERIGRDGDPFQMAKFRSMQVGNPGEDGSVFAEEDDDRVTTVGRFIRKFRIDELPQFWNVLKGEMSLIGPRPEQVGLAQEFTDDMTLYEYRHLVRPGITGWAQVLQGYAADEEETRRKLEHDLYYVKHQSVTLDLLITYLTVKTILSGFGAR